MPAAARSGSLVSASPRRRSRAGWYVLVALVLSVGAIAAYRLLPPFTQTAPPPPAAWVSPEVRRLESTVTTSGTVRLRTGASVRVGSQVSGIVRTLNVTVGSRIRKGDVIAEIDPSPIEARVAEATAQVAMDRIALGKAERDLDRSRRLQAAQIVPLQQTEDLEWQVKAARAKLDSSTTALAASEVDLSYALIRAPISGVVASVSTQEGETVAASFAAPTFVTIIDDAALELVAMVDETDIANVRPGETVVFTVEANPAQELSATVTRVDPTAAIISGVVNYPVTAAIVNKAPFLKPDMTANITIRTAVYEALVVPVSAVHGDGSDRFVYVLKNETPTKQSVTTGVRDGALIEVKKGLTTTDRVVVDPPAGPGSRGT